MEKFMNLYKVPLSVAGIQWYVTTIFQVDRFFFQYDAGLDTYLYRAVKIFYLFFLMAAWCFGFHTVRKYRENHQAYKRGVHVFTICLILLLILLLILWPGTWSWDDLGLIQEKLVYYQWDPWQHILTSIFQMILFQILPFPGGMVLIQNVMIAVCVAFCVVKLENSFDIYFLKYEWLDLLIKFIPFFLPPVLMYQFSGYRMGLYVYLELTMLCMLIAALKQKKEWSISYICFFCFLCAVVSSWRTESFLYIPVVCILIFWLKNAMTRKKMIFTSCFLLLIFFGIRYVQNTALGNSNYEIMSTLRPLTELVRVSDAEKDQECLEIINKVIDLNMVYENPQMNGEGLYWNNVTRPDYTKEDYREYLKAFMKLSIKYPKTVIKERLNLFADCIGMHGQEKMVTNVFTVHLFDDADPNTRAGVFQNMDWVANKPVFPELRKSFLYFLGQISSNDTEYMTFHLVWNGFLPMAIFLIAWGLLMVRKKWGWFMLGLPIFLKIIIIILTQPAAFSMYLLSIYLIGYVIMVYGILYLIKQHFNI